MSGVDGRGVVTRPERRKGDRGTYLELRSSMTRGIAVAAPAGITAAPPMFDVWVEGYGCFLCGLLVLDAVLGYHGHPCK